MRLIMAGEICRNDGGTGPWALTRVAGMGGGGGEDGLRRFAGGFLG